MRCSEYKHESETKHSSLLVVSFLVVFLCASALGSLRLYGLYLENRISETARRIEACKEENVDLARQYSELLSPARIYNYARTNLAMNNPETVKIIKIDLRQTRVASSKTKTDAEEGGFLESLNPFIKKAHAKN